METKETATPKQSEKDNAKFYCPEAGKSIAAKDQKEANKKFKELLGEEKKKSPEKVTPKNISK